MRLTKIVFIVALSAMPVAFFPSDSMASFFTYGLEIHSPEDGDRFETGDVIRVSWTAYCYGQVPPQGIHYRITLDGAELTYDYYDYFSGAIPGQNTYFTARGSFRWIVPGNTYAKIPNAILSVWSGNDDCPNCYDWVASVVISIKMYYDPIPIPRMEP